MLLDEFIRNYNAQGASKRGVTTLLSRSASRSSANGSRGELRRRDDGEGSY